MINAGFFCSLKAGAAFCSWSCVIFSYPRCMQTKATFWLRVWLFDRVHLYQSIRRMDLYFNEAVWGIWMILQSGKIDLWIWINLYSAIIHQREIFWLSIPVNRIQKKSNNVQFSSLWSPTHGFHLTVVFLPPPPPPPLLLCRRISNSWLSTGWFTMTIALELCDRINVYGMVAPDFCRWDSGAQCERSSPTKPSRIYMQSQHSRPDKKDEDFKCIQAVGSKICARREMFVECLNWPRAEMNQ